MDTTSRQTEDNALAEIAAPSTERKHRASAGVREGMHRFAAVASVAAAMLLAACGSSSKSSTSSTSSSTPAASTPASSGSGQTVATSADPSGGLSFTKNNLKAKSGSVTLVMTNPSSSGTSHGIAIQGNGIGKAGQVVSPGSKSTVTVTLKPGKYEFFCPIPSHKAAGMTGTLIVR
jgi:uncharacterized cupredoxin-like copper-binding protein